MSVVTFLIYLLVLCIVFGLVYYIITLLPVPDPFRHIAIILVLVIFLLIVLGTLFGGIPFPRFAS